MNQSFSLRKSFRGGWQHIRLTRLLALALAGLFTLAPLLRSTVADDGRQAHLRPADFSATPSGAFVCGYDPNGADEAVAHHRLNALRLQNRAHTSAASSRAQTVQDTGDIAIVEDDGTIVAAPNKFDLKNRALLFTPAGDGYRVERADTEFNDELGDKLRDFLSTDGQPGNADNGYRDVQLLGAWFPFFGASYDTIFVGTNGYITFTRGDTSARLSAAALAVDAPRIAPLWADLSANKKGIYYNRLDGRHVITWDSLPEASGGKNKFQAVLYDDGRIAFIYKKIKAGAALIGISPGDSAQAAQAVDFSKPPVEPISGPFFESFSSQTRLDLPALTRAFYSAHTDAVDTIFVWADFSYDNGLGIAHSFNVRNDIRGIGLPIFDRGAIYGSPSRLATIITMGNQQEWPEDPQQNMAGIFSAVAIVCHELGHRWLSYIHFAAGGDIKDELLGRDNSHWSFLADTRTNSEGSFSSLMEGNAWRENSNNAFATMESAANYFSPLDQYLMGLRAADDVNPIRYLAPDDDIKALVYDKSPFSGFPVNAAAKTVTISQIVASEGVRVPDAATAPKAFRIAFILLTSQGSTASTATIRKMDAYREALVRYFAVATNRRASLDSQLIKNTDQ
jgi:hypothetical protein